MSVQLGQVIPLFVVIPFFIVFILIWIFVVKILRQSSWMTKVIGHEPGQVIKKSRWGTAQINGVTMRGCARVVEYNEGWVVEVMSIFGGGRLWLPKQGISELSRSERSAFKTNRVTMDCLNHRVELFGHLADFWP